MSHKYHVPRLQLWCERELCKCISLGDACLVLSQAHLYEAKQLEKKCLEFIKANRTEVIKSAAFATLNQEWPALSLKIMLHLADFSESTTDAAIDMQRSTRKRKREGADD
eukprot:gnl/TRDRNA2_/TRDRNA2_177678_c4_seq41.p2 gnl/TRDRNA2_/TRDRNA2_177678_c4~~gnl/TRDRNA2_/TRDRNA2_177678_c4_seq41.p2  ORF type:complete len:110 (+),score=23.36 gnl/TRDRNA2_/TRDRNA2_177678_c4_seq41:468-797(+)